jgi:ribosome recycling factor
MNHGREDHERYRSEDGEDALLLKTDLNKIRTGRASLSLFDDIRVDYYGTPTLLSQVATLSVPEPRLITIQPWDTSITGEIEKAILRSELGLTPASDGKFIRIPIPRLTEERRKELVKVVKRWPREPRWRSGTSGVRQMTSSRG